MYTPGMANPDEEMFVRFHHADADDTCGVKLFLPVVVDAPLVSFKKAARIVVNNLEPADVQHVIDYIDYDVSVFVWGKENAEVAEVKAFLSGDRKGEKEAAAWKKMEERRIEAMKKRRQFVVEYATKKRVEIDARAWWAADILEAA